MEPKDHDAGASNDNKDGTEEPDQRIHEVDDQFRSLLEGLRTTIPGVMVLFSFLLILPLQSSFGQVSRSNTLIFYIAFTSAALSAVLLIAPSVHQRVRAPISGMPRRSMSHVMKATQLAIVGTVFFMVTIAAVVYLVSSLVFTDLLAVLATTVVSGVAGWAWFFLPLIQFRKR